MILLFTIITWLAIATYWTGNEKYNEVKTETTETKIEVTPTDAPLSPASPSADPSPAFSPAPSQTPSPVISGGVYLKF